MQIVIQNKRYKIDKTKQNIVDKLSKMYDNTHTAKIAEYMNNMTIVKRK